MYGFERDPEGYYFGFFEIEREKLVKKIIAKEKERKNK